MSLTTDDSSAQVEKFEFWPSWDPDPQLDRNYLRVEPDVFLRFEDLDIIVEAKRSDFEQLQNNEEHPEQWENELGAWCQEFQSDRQVVLLAIGGNTTVGTCEVELKHLKQHFRVEKLNWGMLRDAVSELSNIFSNDTHLAHVLDQLDNVFEFFGVRSQKMSWLCYLSSTAVKNKVNSSQLSSTLADMRRAYRVLVPFQERMKKTLLYIKEQYRFDDKDFYIRLYPFGAFADRVISKVKEEEIEVWFNNDTFFRNVNFVGFSSVWFGGPNVFSRKRKHNQMAELWGFIVPDDSFIMSRVSGVDNILNMQDAENASGYIVLFATINNNYIDYITEESYNIGDDLGDPLWLVENDKDEGLAKIRELLSSRSDKKIMSNGDEMSILKRYRLEEFADKRHTDRVLRDFAELVLDESGIKIFNDQWY